MKRHTRPYACTRDSCESRFGSKNDWKRHELTIHGPLPEAYRCPEPTNNPPRSPGQTPSNDTTSVSAVEAPFFPGTDNFSNSRPTPTLMAAPRTPTAISTKPCAEVSYTKKEFYEHLSTVHRITRKPKRKECKNEAHIGRNGQLNFWCGFCRALISVGEMRDQEAVEERYKHIDLCHFAKEDYGGVRGWIELGRENTDTETETETEKSPSRGKQARSEKIRPRVPLLRSQSDGRVTRSSSSATSIIPRERSTHPLPNFRSEDRRAGRDTAGLVTNASDDTFLSVVATSTTSVHTNRSPSLETAMDTSLDDDENILDANIIPLAQLFQERTTTLTSTNTSKDEEKTKGWTFWYCVSSPTSSPPSAISSYTTPHFPPSPKPAAF